MAEDDILYNFYMDESGGDRANASTKRDVYYITCGLLVKKQHEENIKKQCRKILNTNGLSSNNELHFTDLVEQRRLNKLDDSIFDNILNQVFELLRISNSILFATVVNKPNHISTYTKPVNEMHSLTSNHMLNRLGCHMNKMQPICDIYFDGINKKFNSDMLEMMADLKKTGFLYYANPKNFNYIRNVQSCGSHNIGGLQLADICCGIIRMAKIHDRFKQYSKIKCFFRYNEPRNFPSDSNWGRPSTIPDLVEISDEPIFSTQRWWRYWDKFKKDSDYKDLPTPPTDLDESGFIYGTCPTLKDIEPLVKWMHSR